MKHKIFNFPYKNLNLYLYYLRKGLEKIQISWQEETIVNKLIKILVIGVEWKKKNIIISVAGIL